VNSQLAVHSSSGTSLSLGQPITEADLVRAFLSGRNERTVKAYSQDLADFRSFIAASTVEEAARMLLSTGHGAANTMALAYKARLVERGLQSATVNRRLAALRSLVQLARIMGLVPWHLEVRNVKAEPFRDTRGPGKQGVHALLAQLDGKHTPVAVRNRCALRLLYDLALRVGEVVSLDAGDVDIAGATLAVRGKGRTAKQLLSVPELTRGALEAWLEVRGPEPGPLFTNLDRANGRGRLSTVGLYNVVRGLGERVGLKVRPHGLRHTAITEACKAAQVNGIGLEEVLDFSRHSRKSIAILMVYRDRERNVQGQLASLVAAAV
jgi:integrase/recombinase XerC